MTGAPLVWIVQVIISVCRIRPDVREVDLGRNIGTDKFNCFSHTTKMTVLTDGAANLVSAFPGVLK